jgi:cellulose synthase/poly-beta-1,6-N-acetylglucosamine synthase-like glycosyltransferase
VTFAFYIFWICLVLIAHTYFLYPIILFLACAASQVRRDWQYLKTRHNRRALRLGSYQLPDVTVVVPLYNEAACLRDKLNNLRQSDYPLEKLEIVLVSDGSTDGTNEILENLRDPNVKIALLPHRKGKWNALNVGVATAQHEILVFSDGSALFDRNAILCLVRHFKDPAVGVVCGALEFTRTLESERTDGVYWGYESMMRLMEARLGATLGASGAIYALRRECYFPLAPNTIMDDFLIPMTARNAGYRVLYDPEARATDVAASSVAGEFARRVRVAAGSYRILGSLVTRNLLSFCGFAFFSHRLLRWMLPFLLMGLLASSSFLLARPLYRLVFIAQLVFCLWAAVGFLFRRRLERVRYGLMGYFMFAINMAFLVGFWRFLFGREEATWQRVK